ncbi:hypothetical protein [Prosthecobacter sp.]|uniref:hypothetical protein n=1 Tax=Prosthecobacter sp. TaxID=1965333 RepID=UPI0024885F6A|nr:hypothetical protein [Prosthecobacter sp.]MDI1310867.1 hypothetical protein [Prosthecobacter sp.]
MNETFLPAATLQRMRMVFMGALLVCLCSCMQEQHADQGSTFHKGLQRDAWRTLSSYDEAVLKHRETFRREIPPTYWDLGIQRLHPVKVYTHRGNLVVVQSVTDGVEHGKYIDLPVARFHPVSAWFSNKHVVNGFVFRPARGTAVFNFTRTAVREYSRK